MSKKINTIKTVGICKRNLDCTRGCKGIFEYQIDGIKYYNVESSSHIGWFKIEKKYAIYVKKNNYEQFVSRKMLFDILFFEIIFGIILTLEILGAVY